MVIFYTNSVSSKPGSQKVYDYIVSHLQSLGNKVISLEFMDYSDLLDMKKAKSKEKKISIHNQFIRKAIELSDAAVFEASFYSFKLGQEAQMALDKKVPVLCLSNDLDYSTKVQDPYFYPKMYSSNDELKKHINDFLKTVKSNHMNKRVNVFLHNKHLNYLDWYVKTHDGSNRSEIIREALEREIENNDKYNTR